MLKITLFRKFFLFLFASTFLFATPLELYFKGNESISSRELYSALELDLPYAYEFYKKHPTIKEKTAPLFVGTIQNYYKTKGYFNAKVSFEKTSSSFYINIQEGDPVVVKNITVESDDDLIPPIIIKKGDLFEADNFSNSKKDILNTYRNLGYCNPKIQAKAWIDIEKNWAYLVYKLEKNKLCYFGKISTKSTATIDKDIIDSLLYIQEGDPFSLQRINQSYQNIYLYDGISQATIGTTVKDYRVDVNVSVEENQKPIRFQAGLGYNTNEKAMVSLGIKHRNFLKNLKTLSLQTRVSEVKQTLKTNFDVPLLNKNFTGLELGFENEDFIGFKEKRVFASGYLRQHRIEHDFKESLVLDRVNIYNSDDQLLFKEQNLLVLSPKLEWNYDTRDDVLDPRRGFTLGAELMFSKKSKLSDATYYKYKLLGSYIASVDETVLGIKARYGSQKLLDGELPPSYRFFSGGMYSNRAYNYRRLGDTNHLGEPVGAESIFETTAELRFGVYTDIRGVVFSDNTYIAQSNTSPDFKRGYHSAGLGLRYVTPIGPLAIDVGFDIDDPKEQYAVHFHIGELF